MNDLTQALDTLGQQRPSNRHQAADAIRFLDRCWDSLDKAARELLVQRTEQWWRHLHMIEGASLAHPEVAAAAVRGCARDDTVVARIVAGCVAACEADVAQRFCEELAADGNRCLAHAALDAADAVGLDSARVAEIAATKVDHLDLWELERDAARSTDPARLAEIAAGRPNRRILRSLCENTATPLDALIALAGEQPLPFPAALAACQRGAPLLAAYAILGRGRRDGSGVTSLYGTCPDQLRVAAEVLDLYLPVAERFDAATAEAITIAIAGGDQGQAMLRSFALRIPWYTIRRQVPALGDPLEAAVTDQLCQTGRDLLEDLATKHPASPAGDLAAAARVAAQ